jgi:UDP-GlcNAc:undecaprenyl-phosphate GlcNAc-1-phosphate transferase
MFTNQIIIHFFIFFISILFFSLFINSVLLKFSVNLGVRQHDANVIRWTKTTKPSIGGFAFYISFLISFLFYMIYFNQTELISNLEYIGILTVTSIAFLMGLADDAYNTNPLLKFLVQLICGVILIHTGNMIQITPWYGFNYCITLFWIVGIMNSINMLDNMDAATTLTAIMISITSLIYLFSVKSLGAFYTVIIVGLLASLFAFLYYNWHPSKMYMGDTGSQFLGIILAILGIRLLWNGTDVYHVPVQTKQFLSVLLVFIVPIADTTTVFINRILKGRSPFVGGKDHTTHHLVYLGLKLTHAVSLLGIISLVSGLYMVFGIQQQEAWGWINITIAVVYYLMVTVGLYLTTRIKNIQPN